MVLPAKSHWIRRDPQRGRENRRDFPCDGPVTARMTEDGMSTVEFSSLTKDIRKFAVLGSSVAALAMSAACGSSSTSTSPSMSSTTPPPLKGPSGGENATAGVVQCSNFHTSYEGDEQCIEPPPPGKGFQFHYGPSDYNDAAEVKAYTLAPNSEVTDCVTFPTPNDTEVYFDEYHSRMRPGSHHLLLYIQSAKLPETGKGGPSPCNLAGEINTINLFGAQTATLDVKGLGNDAAENAGMAVRIPARQQGIMQIHFINTGSKPILREAWANVVYTDKSQVTQLGAPIFFIAGVTMNIAKGQTQVIHGTAAVPTNAGPDFRLIAATPHYHTHTNRFTVTATIDGQTETILDNFPKMHVLPEPALVAYDSVQKNPAPNETARTDGASSGIVHLKPGDKIDWSCTMTNDDQPNPITFGNAVYTGEMCNLFGLYGPTTDSTPWSAPNP
jgi:hypothetical protein